MRKTRQSFFDSIKNALRGIFLTLYYERNIKIQAAGAIVAAAFGFYFRITPVETLFLVMTITLVLFAEMVNSALEVHVDIVVEEKRYKALAAKDIAAGAVLITVINALIVGTVIFLPRILALAGIKG